MDEPEDTNNIINEKQPNAILDAIFGQALANKGIMSQ